MNEKIEPLPQIETGNDLIDNALNTGQNKMMAEISILHKRQIIRRVKLIKILATNNNHGDVDLMGAALSHISDKLQEIVDDYDHGE